MSSTWLDRGWYGLAVQRNTPERLCLERRASTSGLTAAPPDLQAPRSLVGEIPPIRLPGTEEPCQLTQDQREGEADPGTHHQRAPGSRSSEDPTSQPGLQLLSRTEAAQGPPRTAADPGHAWAFPARSLPAIRRKAPLLQNASLPETRGEYKSCPERTPGQGCSPGHTTALSGPSPYAFRSLCSLWFAGSAAETSELLRRTRREEQAEKGIRGPSPDDGGADRTRTCS